MPINRELYAEDWPAISFRVRFVRAEGKCEGSPMFPDCRAAHGQLHPVTGRVVYLQCAHWPDPNPANNSEENLWSWCPRCHNAMDALMRWSNRRRRIRERQRQAGQLDWLLMGLGDNDQRRTAG